MEYRSARPAMVSQRRRQAAVGASSVAVTALVCVALAGPMLYGCAPPPPSIEVERDATPAEDGVERPSVAAAEQAVLAIARDTYPSIPTASAEVVGMGQDAEGRWWVQAWTSAGPGYEGEQWFVSWDGADWEFQDSGTGMERSDYSQVTAWEDVE